MSGGTGTGTPSAAYTLKATALLTIANAKTYCGILDATWDATLAVIINAVSEAFNSSCGRALAKTTYADNYIDGNGERDLLLPRYPIVEVSALTENDVALTEGTTADYVLYTDEGRLHRLGRWYKGPKTIKLTYKAGYVAIPGAGETENLPADLALAIRIQVAHEWQKMKSSAWGETARSFPDGSITYLSKKEFLPEVEQVLARYRDYRF